LTLKSQTFPRLLKIGNVKKIVEVAGIEPANIQAHVYSTDTIEAKQKQINKKEFKRMGVNRAIFFMLVKRRRVLGISMVLVPGIHQVYGIARGPKRRTVLCHNRFSSVPE
jgi:hypothetical protein